MSVMNAAEWKCYCYSAERMEILQNKDIAKPGLYILGTCSNNSFHPRYVGRAEDMRLRIREHEIGKNTEECVAELMNKANRANVIIKFIEFTDSQGDMYKLQEFEKYMIFRLRDIHDLCNEKRYESGAALQFDIEPPHSCGCQPEVR